MANAYSAPNFNIDTSTNVAGLVALKGSALATTDKAYVFNGATLTLESDPGILLVSLGETSSGAATAGQRVGHLTFNAGVTVTWTGNGTITNSGVKCNPASAATESKGCTLSLNGTDASPVIMTNSAGGPSASYRWKIVMTYGVIGAWGTVTLKYMSNVNTDGCIILPINSTYTTSTEHNLTGATTLMFGAHGNGEGFAIVNGNSGGGSTFTLNINLGQLIWDATSGPASAYMYVQYRNKVPLLTWRGLRVINAGAGQTVYIGPDLWSTGASNAHQSSSFRAGTTVVAATEVVPADFALTDMQDGSVKFTVSNISSIAAGDYVVVYLTDGTPIFACTRTEYEADISGDNGKPANCGLIRRMKTGTAYTGLYAKYTSDLFVYGAASGTANVTPTLVPAAADVRETVTFGLNAAYRAGTLPQAKILVSGSGSYVEPVQADVLRPADGGTAYGPSGGTNGTLDLSAAEAAAAAAQLAVDIAEVNTHTNEIKKGAVVLTGADAGTYPAFIGSFQI